MDDFITDIDNVMPCGGQTIIIILIVAIVIIAIVIRRRSGKVIVINRIFILVSGVVHQFYFIYSFQRYAKLASILGKVK